jgi:membrane associated rhomboid family serine protease
VLPERTETKSQLPFEPHSSIVVPALLIANVLWFLVGLIATIWGHYSIWTYLLGGNGDVCHRLGSVGGEDILRGEWWRLLTSCFVHGGGIHLLVNLSALAVIGPLAELLWGSRRFAVIYLFSGLGGSCLAMALHPQDSVVGASGAIWGVLMSLVVWFIAWRVKLPSDVTIDAGRRLALAIVLNAGANALPGISWQSHLGGAAVGLIAAALMHVIRFANPERRRIALGVLLALPVLSVGGLAVFMGRSEHWLAYKELVAKVHAQRIATAAGKSFDEEVIPILKQLNPRPPMSEEEALKIQFHARRGSFVYLPPLSPILHAATTELLLPGTRRNAVAVAETREKLTDLKALADSAIQLLTVPPSGVDSLDRRRELSRNFAEAQSRCFELTLQMLASPNLPTSAAWNLWGEAKRTSQSLWDQMLQKP